MTSPAATPALPLPGNGFDFPDRLSPIIVKELRQGLRTKVFVTLFIAVQALMSLIVIVSLTAAANGVDASAGTGFFWIMIGLPVVFILPFRGFGSVSNEIKAKTLDLVLLTRLSARRIIVGKWLAIVAQTALFVCAVLPYVVLRYFLGGVNLTDELIGLVWMLFASAVFTAITVGLSPYQNRLSRVFIWIAVIIFAQAFLPFLLFVGYGNTGVLAGTPGIDWTFWLLPPTFGTLVLLLMLEVGAAKIAPEAENHTAGKRLVAALLLLVGGGFTVAHSATGLGVTIAAFVIGIIIIIGALCEPVRLNAGLFRPYARHGFLGRVAGRFLYPGWPAGALFAIAFFIASTLLFRANDAFADTRVIIGYLAVIGALLLPAALTRAFLPNTTRPLTIFVAFQAFCLVSAIVILTLDGIFSSHAGNVVALLPASGLIVSLSNQFDGINKRTFLTVYSIIIVFSTAVLLLRSRAPWKQIRALESETPKLKNPSTQKL